MSEQPLAPMHLFKDLVENYCTIDDKIERLKGMINALTRNYPILNQRHVDTIEEMELIYDALLRKRDFEKQIDELDATHTTLYEEIKATLIYHNVKFQYKHLIVFKYPDSGSPEQYVNYEFFMDENHDLTVSKTWI